MNTLNFYSLSRNVTYDKLREYEKNKLINLKKVNYRLVFFLNNQLLTKDQNNVFYSTKKIPIQLKKAQLSYIASFKDDIYILCNIDEVEVQKVSLLDNFCSSNLRDFVCSLNKIHASVITTAYALYRWHKNNRFCGVCGVKTKIQDNGYSIVCTNARCRKRVFPSVFPTVIVNIIKENKILLARNKDWKRNLYSCLAGFCEQSESAEEAVQREVNEEVGLGIKNIKYKYSQYWPFTSNLMLGFEAEVIQNKSKIIINKNELSEAKWFSSKEILALKRKKKIILPRKDAIAYKLIENWIKKN